MVSEIFRTPHLTLDFEDSEYGPGQPIEVTLYVDPGDHEVEINSGRVRLECEVRRIERYDSVPADHRWGITGLGDAGLTPPRPHRAAVVRHENFVLDSAVVTENTRLPSGLSTFVTSLQLKSDVPLEPGNELVAARVTAHLDIPHGRDVHAEKRVRLHLD